MYYSQPFCIRADGVPAHRRIFFPQQTDYQQISSNINKYQKNARKTAARFCCVPAALSTFPLRKRSGLIQNSDKLHTLLSPFFSFTRLFRTIPAFFITITAAFLLPAPAFLSRELPETTFSACAFLAALNPAHGFGDFCVYAYECTNHFCSPPLLSRLPHDLRTMISRCSQQGTLRP